MLYLDPNAVSLAEVFGRLAPLLAQRREVRGEAGSVAELVPAHGDGWYLNWMEVPDGARGRGHGTALLLLLCVRADRDGYALHLLPMGDDAAHTRMLRRWYARHGFVDVPANRFGQVGMRRAPQTGGR